VFIELTIGVLRRLIEFYSRYRVELEYLILGLYGQENKAAKKTMQIKKGHALLHTLFQDLNY
jgi:hypothetical protein